MKNGTVTYTPVAFFRKGSSKADAIAIANRKTLKRHRDILGGDSFESYNCEPEALYHLIREFKSMFYMDSGDKRNVQAWMIKEVDGVRTAELICEHHQKGDSWRRGLFSLEILYIAEAWKAYPYDAKKGIRFYEWLLSRHEPQAEEKELPMAA